MAVSAETAASDQDLLPRPDLRVAAAAGILLVGGALAIGVGNRVNMLEFSVYSVISPEGCAAILWRDPAKSREAAQAMKMTAPDLAELDIVDEVIPEVTGGAHVDAAGQATLVGDILERQLEELEGWTADQLVSQRHERFRQLGRCKIPPA